MDHATPSPADNPLIRSLDRAVDSPDRASLCAAVKHALERAVGTRDPLIAPPFLEPVPDRYARRLLHRDPQGRYTVVVMVWGRGQGTPLHDHAGMWCVECVYRGRIRVRSFDLLGDPAADIVHFAAADEVLAGVGEAGALIPPHEYHWIRNPDPEPAVTIHVYGGEMNHSRVFLPIDGGGYRREQHALSYTA